MNKNDIKKLKLEYKPIIKSIKIDGISGSIALEGEKVRLIQKTFITSFDKMFHITCNNLMNIVSLQYGSDRVNSLLVKIDENDTALIYTKFPIQHKVRLKNSKKAGTLIYKNEIIDIDGIEFKDAITSIEFSKTDKIIWLFRNNWKFGLYFDFSRNINNENLSKELAECYKSLEYYNLYSVISKEDNFREILNDGWFPFIQLLSDEFITIAGYFKLSKERKNKFIESHVKKYTNDKIKAIYERWWNNKQFEEKKDVLIAGLNAFMEGTKSGYINSIKTLSTEIEGIIRLSFCRELGKNPSTSKMVKYIIKKGKDKFTSIGSLAFPQFFLEYLKGYFFKGFSISDNKLPNSRHSVVHGVLPPESYSMIEAFKLILILDQIYFFL